MSTNCHRQFWRKNRTVQNNDSCSTAAPDNWSKDNSAPAVVFLLQ